MPRTALLVGGTGLVGGYVLDNLLQDARWSRVIGLARRSMDRVSDKLVTHVVDFEALASGGQALALGPVDDVFACLGTTIKAAGNQARFRRVDHDYTLAVARLAREAGAQRLALVSSIGANEFATNFYLRVKGETERDVRDLEYRALVIARPSVLVGERRELRVGERAGIVALSALSPFMIGRLRAYRPVGARDVAAAIVDALATGESGVRLLTHDALAGRASASSVVPGRTAR